MMYRVFKIYSFLLLLILFFQLGVCWIFHLYKVPGDFSLIPPIYLLVCVYFILSFLLACFYVLFDLFRQINNVNYRLQQSFSYLWSRFANKVFLFQVVFLLTIFAYLSNMVDRSRSMINFIVPFYLDPFCLKLQSSLFFGWNFWKVMAHCLTPVLIYFFNSVYALWALLVFFSFCFVSYQQFSFQKIHFFLSFILVWFLLGVVMATLLSSCGPCYVDFFYSTHHVYLHHYLGLLKQMEIYHWGIESHRLQAFLLHQYMAKHWSLFSGITAMPSLHVATAFMIYLYVKEYYAKLSAYLLIYSLLIWVATVILAWHSLIDGLVSFVSVWCLYRFSGWLLRRPWFQSCFNVSGGN